MQIVETPDTLAGSLVSRIRDAVHDGTLEDGARINEVHLAAELGVSRTPLREALNRLVSEQTLILRPRHGYSIARMTIDGFEAEYGIRPILDVAALRLAGLPPSPVLEELARLNRALLEADTPAEQIERDDAFHLKLLAHTPNPVLIDLIQKMMLRTRRYEFAYFRECKPVLKATDQHDRILAGLRSGDLDRACAALHENLTTGLGPMRDWLASRPSHRPT